MVKIYIINGKGKSGKDTFVNFIKGNKTILKTSKVLNLSTIDPIKEMAKIIGWNGEKDLKSREFLSDLKDLTTKYNDASFNYIIDKIRYETSILDYKYNLIVFIHCREPEEIIKLKDFLNAETILVIRKSLENTHYGNHADDMVGKYNYDYNIFNSLEGESGLLKLNKLADNFVEYIILSQ